jgi:hypothetical protein
MRLTLLAFIYLLLFNLKGQKPEFTPAYLAQYKVKLSLFDQTMFSMPVMKVSNEFLIKKNGFPGYAGLDLGYNFYSIDEDVKSGGYYIGTRYNLYTRSEYNIGKGVSFGLFYMRSAINDYLKISHKQPGIGTYHEYEKMKYHKERYGVTVEHFDQYALSNKFIIEASIGGGVIIMNTIVPERVTQETFVNGLTNEQAITVPTVFFNFKIGYLVF